MKSPSPYHGIRSLTIRPLALITAGLLSGGIHAAAPKAPNVVLILADDLGYNDLACYGASKIKTPHIDKLARQGIRFTDGHAASPVCCPSRYALMTGSYPWRAPRRDTWGLWATHESACLLAPGQPTLATALRQAGYHTGAIGKWHLGLMNEEKDWNKDLAPGPLEHGFDYFFGDASNRFKFYIENHRVAGLVPEERIEGKGGNLTLPKSVWKIDNESNARVLNAKACDFIRRQAGDGPFFMYYAPHNVHVPLTPGPDFKGRSGAGAYGDFVEELDWSVGEIVRALAETGVLEQTLIIFTSDNGGRLDPSALGRGHRANGIYLGQKTDLWEGGIRIPLIMQWPGVIRAGRVSDTPVMLTDLLPTFMEITKTPAPEGWSGDGASLLALLKGQPASGDIPGRTLAFNWGNRSLTFAVRRGEWLYIDRQGSGGVAVGGEPGKAQASHYLTYAQAGFENSDILPDGTIKSDAPKEQLYNLQTDPAQKTNVVRQFPEKAAALREALAALRQPFARRTPPAKPMLNDERAK